MSPVGSDFNVSSSYQQLSCFVLMSFPKGGITQITITSSSRRRDIFVLDARWHFARNTREVRENVAGGGMPIRSHKQQHREERNEEATRLLWPKFWGQLWWVWRFGKLTRCWGGCRGGGMYEWELRQAAYVGEALQFQNSVFLRHHLYRLIPEVVGFSFLFSAFFLKGYIISLLTSFINY